MNKRVLSLLSVLFACSGMASAAGKAGLPPGSKPPRAAVTKAGPLDFKIDPELRYTLRRVEELGLERNGARISPQQASTAAELPNVVDFTNERQVLVPVFLKTSDPASARSLVGELGGASSTFAGGYLTARVPPDEVAHLASSPLVEMVYGVAPSSPELDRSRVEMKADTVHVGTGLPGPMTGKGVIVGIFDTGVDINHPDFKTPDGKTRILYYWDTTSSGNPPAGFSVGWEYTAADIDAGSCSAKDTDGHGTHVAGAAAGNGRFGSGTYTGIAPDADIIVVGLTGPVSSTEAVDYMFRKAAALGRPIVVNMSAGSQSGDHDGTSPDEIGISALLGPGKVFVKSAGNDGGRRRHVVHTIKGSDYQSGLSTGLVLDSASSASVRGVGALAGATFGVAVYNGGTLAASTEVKAGARLDRAPLKNGTGDTIGYVAVDASDASSSKGHVFVAIDTAASDLAWELYTYGTGQMDAWTTKGDFSAKADTGYVPGDTRTTLTIPGTARRALTVGAHITKTSWTDVDGNLQERSSWCNSGDIRIGAIACFSSRGPTWDGRTKPDFTAPGMFIASALSGSLDTSSAALRKQIVSGGGYQIMQGTSMAAPHVTGLVALMLQGKPTLDDAGALAALKQTAVRDSSTGGEPDGSTWGAGKVDALEAVKAVAGAGSSATTLFVPVVLKSSGANNSYYTSEMTLTNRGSATAGITFLYTAAAGGGTGSGTASLPPGRQLIVPDAIEYLRAQGVPIPDSGNRVGTLRVQFNGVSASDVAVLVRTTTPVPTDAPTGAAGLAYTGVPVSKLPTGPVVLCGLRRDALDRSNIAVQNAGDEAQGSIDVRIEVFKAQPGTGSPIFSEDATLSPGGFKQVTPSEFSSGYARVTRTSGSAPYYAYAVINDNLNSDGSFVLPVEEASLGGTNGLTLPVALEASVYQTEAVFSNLSGETKTLKAQFYADALGASPAVMSVVLAGGDQLAFTNVIDELRKAQSIPSGVVGPIFVTVEGGSTKGIFVGGRTGNPGGGGRYSLFYPAVPFGAASTSTAWINGLQQTSTSRSNVALVNTGEFDGSSSTFLIEIFDGDSATKTGETTVTVPAKRFQQTNAILGLVAPGTTNAYARVTRTSGTNPFVTYGVINDGGIPGQRSGDGAFVLSE